MNFRCTIRILLPASIPALPERYLWDVAETIKDGTGFPKLINDEEVVPLYVSKGATFEEALDYAVSGCTEARMPNRDTYTSGGAYINFAAAVEMVLRNGRMKKIWRSGSWR